METKMQPQIKVGDRVTWRSGKSKMTPKSRGIPIGIANCRVLELGNGPKGEPAAMLKLPPMFQDDDGKLIECGALIADLETD